MESFPDEFDLPERLVPVTPTEPGLVLMKAKADESLENKLQSVYWLGVGKLIHIMKWLQFSFSECTI